MAKLTRKQELALAQPRSNDETFQFLICGFNVRRALEIIGDRPPNGKIQPSKMFSFARIDEEYALSDSVDVDKPVILVTLPRDYGVLSIDGHHRAFKAQHIGREFLAAHLLNEEESRACCYTPDAWQRMTRKQSMTRRLK